MVEGELMEVLRIAAVENARVWGEIVAAAGAVEGLVVVRTWVWRRVLTTSMKLLVTKTSYYIGKNLPKGHVIIPAKPPAIAPVPISRPRPISGPFQLIAHFRNSS